MGGLTCQCSGSAAGYKGKDFYKTKKVHEGCIACRGAAAGLADTAPCSIRTYSLETSALTNKDIRLLCERHCQSSEIPSACMDNPQRLPLYNDTCLHDTSLPRASELLILLQGFQHGYLLNDNSLFLLELLILCRARRATLHSAHAISHQLDTDTSREVYACHLGPQPDTTPDHFSGRKTPGHAIREVTSRVPSLPSQLQMQQFTARK